MEVYAHAFPWLHADAPQTKNFVSDCNLDMAPRKSLCEQLEGVDPIVTKEARDAPKHAERLDCSSGFGTPHIDCFPTKLSDNPSYGLLS